MVINTNSTLTLSPVIFLCWNDSESNYLYWFYYIIKLWRFYQYHTGFVCFQKTKVKFKIKDNAVTYGNHLCNKINTITVPINYCNVCRDIWHNIIYKKCTTVNWWTTKQKSTIYNDLINFGVGGDNIKHKASLPLYWQIDHGIKHTVCHQLHDHTDTDLW